MQCIQLVGISPQQLQDAISQDIKCHFDELKKNFQPKAPTVYLTRSEVAKMLQIDLSTVHNWTVKNKLQSYGIGGRIYYKLAEVEQSIIKL